MKNSFDVLKNQNDELKAQVSFKYLIRYPVIINISKIYTLIPNRSMITCLRENIILD